MAHRDRNSPRWRGSIVTGTFDLSALCASALGCAHDDVRLVSWAGRYDCSGFVRGLRDDADVLPHVYGAIMREALLASSCEIEVRAVRADGATMRRDPITLRVRAFPGGRALEVAVIAEPDAASPAPAVRASPVPGLRSVSLEDLLTWGRLIESLPAQASNGWRCLLRVIAGKNGQPTAHELSSVEALRREAAHWHPELACAIELAAEELRAGLEQRAAPATAARPVVTIDCAAVLARAELGGPLPQERDAAEERIHAALADLEDEAITSSPRSDLAVPTVDALDLLISRIVRGEVACA